MLKEAQRHPVRGDTVHVDLLRVRLDRPIHAVVALELTGVDESPGVREGGVLEQITRELGVEALPTAIPEAVVHDVSAMQIGETLTLAAVAPPAGVTLLDDPEETVLATLTPPRLQTEAETELEAETEVVGEAETRRRRRGLLVGRGVATPATPLAAVTRRCSRARRFRRRDG